MGAVHDRGGRPTDAPIDRSEHELADWEVLMDAIVGALLASVGLLAPGTRVMPDEFLPHFSWAALRAAQLRSDP